MSSCNDDLTFSWTLQLVAELRGHDSAVWSVVWRPQTRELGSCGGRRLLVWSNENGWKLKSVVFNEEEEPCLISDHAKALRSIEVTTVPEIPNVKQINVESIEVTNSGVHERTIRNIGWTADGRVLAAASFDATISVWTENELGQWTCRAKLEGHENEVKAAAWSYSQRQIATCSRDKTVWIHSLTRESKIDGIESLEFLCSAVLSGHEQDVKNVVWHPSQDLIASASYDNFIRLWAPLTPDTVQLKIEDEGDSDWRCVSKLEGHLSTVWSLSFSPSGNELASASDDKTVRIWTTSVVSPETNTLPPQSIPEPTSQSSSNLGLVQQTTKIQSPKLRLHPWLYVSPAFRSVVTTKEADGSTEIVPDLNHPDQDGIDTSGRSHGDVSSNLDPLNTNLTEPSSASPSVSASLTCSTPLLAAAPLVSNCPWYCSAVISGYHHRTIYCVAWHPRFDVIATACGDDSIRLFERKCTPSSIEKLQWTLICSIPNAHGSDVNSVSWKTSPEEDGSWLLASSGDDGVIRIFRFLQNTR